jgi:uncharacterized membrane protein
MAVRRYFPVVASFFFLVSCGDDGAAACPDPSTNVVLGCPSFTCEGQAAGEDGAAADTYDSFAEGFFEGYCARCHSTSRTLTSGCSVSAPLQCRNGAPVGFNWDDPASIRERLPRIRRMVGERNEMPVSAPFPTCDERRRIVAWIDDGAPGLP